MNGSQIFSSSVIGTFWSHCCCWFPPCHRLQPLPFPGSRGCTQGQEAAEYRKVDQVIVGTGIEPGLVSAFPEPWGLAGCGPTPWMTAWRTGGRTGAPLGGLGDSGHLVSSSGMPWAPAGWGNNRLRSRSWKYKEQSRTTRVS